MLFGVAASLIAGQAIAQDFPARPLRMIVASGAGGGTDLAGRNVAKTLTDALHVPAFVENRPGAGSATGSEFVAKSNPDGHTLLFSSGSSIVMNGFLYKNLPYDSLRDFVAVGFVAAYPFLLVTRPDLPATDVPSLIALLRAAPGRYNFASSGAGAPPHLAAVLFQEMTGTRMEHVPYAGDTPALTDLTAGHVDLGFMSLSAVKALVDAGRLKALAVTDPARNPIYPAIPTVAEAGLAGYEIGTWWGLVAPRGTPDEVIARTNAAVVQALRAPDVLARFSELGITPVGSTPEAFGTRIRDDVERFGRIVRSAGLSP